MRERREWEPERLIEYINHFLDRGYVVSLLMDLCHCSINHSTRNQTWYYSEAGLLCREREIEYIILLLSILCFSPFLPYSEITELQNKQYLGYCSQPSLSPFWVNEHLRSWVWMEIIPDVEQSHQKFTPDQESHNVPDCHMFPLL